ncbi:MAG: endonuclease III [Propionibacteriaceae bacterium]|nr:endonuclease III [Propionibacteriaceae bacterium]
MLDLLEQTYPDATCELDFSSAFQLLVATILSAQSTDRRVNRVTPALFHRYPVASALADADLADVEEIIHPVGFYRAKAQTIVRMSAQLVEGFGGEVPDTLEDLVTLSGVGRKTANVILGEWFGVPGITADTHVLRLSRRLGWTTQTDPVKVEKDLCALFPRDTWISLCEVVIWHGRRRCHARRPACGACPVAHLCPSFGEGETDPVIAAGLVSEPRR